MIRMFMGDTMFYSPKGQSGTVAILSPKMVEELGKASTLTFTLPHTNAAYSSIAVLKSNILVEEFNINTMGRKVLFYGRPLSVTRDFYNRKEVDCEGALAFLNDSILPPHSWHEDTGTKQEYLNWMLNTHNEQVNEDRRIYPGNIYWDNAVTCEREQSEYMSTLEALADMMAGDSGAYITRTTWYGTGTNTTRTYLDIISPEVPTGTTTQDIRFAQNLLDFEEFVDATEVFTRLIPLGPSQGDDELPMTIGQVNNNVDYLEVAALREKYGIITRTKTYSDVETVEELLAAAQEDISNTTALTEATTLTINAADLSKLGVEVNALTLGGWNNIISRPHNFSTQMQCTRVSRNFERFDDDEYTFGRTNGHAVTATITGVSAGVSNLTNTTGQLQNVVSGMGTTVGMLDEAGANSKRNYYAQYYNGTNYMLGAAADSSYHGHIVSGLTTAERNAIVYTIHKTIGEDLGGAYLVAQTIRDCFDYLDYSKTPWSLTPTWRQIISTFYSTDYWTNGQVIDVTDETYSVAWEAYRQIFVNGNSAVRHKIFAYASTDKDYTQYGSGWYRVLYYAASYGWPAYVWSLNTSESYVNPNANTSTTGSGDAVLVAAGDASTGGTLTEYSYLLTEGIELKQETDNTGAVTGPDLNTLTEPGNYYSFYNIFSVNGPVNYNVAFTLKVESSAGHQNPYYLRQTFREWNSNDVYVRYSILSSGARQWQAWIKNPTRAEMDAITQNAWLLTGGTALTTNTDLNTIMTPGNYYCYTNSAMVNSPVSRYVGFTLKVESAAGEGTDYLRQTFREWDTNVIYIRHTDISPYSGEPTWLSWEKKPTRTELTQMQSDLEERWSLTGGTVVASGANLNSLTTPGNYYSWNVIAVTNGPVSTSTAFVLKVESSAGYLSSSYVRQTFRAYNTNVIYVRYLAGSTWSSWEAVGGAASSAVAAVVTRLDAFNGTNNTIENWADNVDGYNSYFTSRISGMTSSINSMQSSIGSILSRLNYFNSGSDSIEDVIDDILDRLDALEGGS